MGVWYNLNQKTDHLQSVTLARRGEAFSLSARVPDEAGSASWAAVPAQVYVADGTNKPMGFHARFKTATAETCLAANVMQGLCVIQTYTDFQDQSGRSNYFSKEFFRRRQTTSS